MSRKPSLTPDQTALIHASCKTQKELAKEFGVSLLTIWKVKNHKEAYAVKPQDLGTPVLDGHGDIIDIRNETIEPRVIYDL